jgi:hypothetical protein
MAIATQPRGYVDRPRPSGLVDVIDVILDKGLVIDIYVRVALVGIELLTIDARIVIASVDTYLRFAEAVNRLDITEQGQAEGLPQLMESLTSGGSKSKTEGALEGVKEKIFGSDDDDDDDDDGSSRSSKRRSSSRSSGDGRSSSKKRSRSGRSGGDNG